jgi:ferric-dicitrate binding protein FerR (iron transport regulator)
VKTLASILVGVPTIIFATRIRRYSERSVENAEAIDRIENVLRLFEEGYYGMNAPYPREWAGKLSKRRKERNTQNYYSAIMLLMGFCVIATVWLLL